MSGSLSSVQRRLAMITILALAASACARGAAADRRALNSGAEQYVRLVLSLGERDPDSLDVYSGPAEWKDDARKAYRPLGEIRADAERLRASLRAEDGDPIDERRRFLGDQLGAVIARIDLLRGARLSFDDEARELFGITPPPPDRSKLRAIHAELDQILPGRGALSDRYRDLESRFIVAPDRVSQVFTAALDMCRARTRDHIPLPADERVEVEIQPSRSPWAAFTQYLGDHRSRIRINGAFAFTVDRLRQLACHEAYPGHHTAYVLQDDELIRRQHRIELFVVPQFSPQTFVSEGAATYAPDLVFAPSDRAKVDETLMPGTAPAAAASINEASINKDGARQPNLAHNQGERRLDLEAYVQATAVLEELGPFELDIARQYLDGRLEFARAAAAFTNDTLMADPMPVLKFLNEFRSYVVTYTEGRDEAARTVERAGPDESARWRTYRRLLLMEH